MPQLEREETGSFPGLQQLQNTEELTVPLQNRPSNYKAGLRGPIRQRCGARNRTNRVLSLGNVIDRAGSRIAASHVCRRMQLPITPPPPVLASARVVAYAAVDDEVTYTGDHPPVVAGRAIGPVPRLAIGRTLAAGEFTLLHCDAEWDVLAQVPCASADAARQRAEVTYAGLAQKWETISFTDAEVDAFLDDEDRGLICSFCGRHPHEVARIVTGHRGAAICEICIKALRGQ